MKFVGLLISSLVNSFLPFLSFLFDFTVPELNGADFGATTVAIATQQCQHDFQHLHGGKDILKQLRMYTDIQLTFAVLLVGGSGAPVDMRDDDAGGEAKDPAPTPATFLCFDAKIHERTSRNPI